MKKYIYCFVLIFSCGFSQEKNEIFAMFYNVENLFDTIDDKSKNDNEFLPNSKKKWNSEKYFHKLNQLEKVFSSINNKKIPNIIGLCEVENKLVIDDLLKQPFFKNHSFQILHQESPDNRGIDCAILFDAKFELIKSDFIEIKIPESSRPTRDIVYVELKVNNTESLHLFVNHWPSRWGGTEKTEHKRIYTANVLKKYIEKNIGKNGNILLMGDFNDYPSNKSITENLEKTKKVKFTNLMSFLEGKNNGSYNYKGEWGFLDHIIISSNLLEKSGCRKIANKLKVTKYGVFKEDWMLYEGKKPNRTYGGLNKKTGLYNWYGGFSDHLPIYCVIKFL